MALLNLNDGEDINDLQLQHLDIRKILKTTDTGGTRELQLATSLNTHLTMGEHEMTS